MTVWAWPRVKPAVHRLTAALDVSRRFRKQEFPARYYFLFVNDKQTGPHTLGELKAMWVRGELPGSSLYASPGMSQWETLSTIQCELLLCELPTKEPGSPARGITPTLASASAPEGKSPVEASPVHKAKPSQTAMALRRCERCGRQRGRHPSVHAHQEGRVSLGVRHQVVELCERLFRHHGHD